MVLFIHQVKPVNKQRKKYPNLRYIKHELIGNGVMETVEIQKQLSVQKLKGIKHSLKIEK